ncbi:Detected protein of confused Function [Hibiscus syriacus]|uniref:Detected protein of confused Function n=1 Tax=Hibiscus syriacus TaxID=106335 RepID=A0A6A3C8M6_HIBSY|nr:Detected protein of confused Function [Hibiscus syriacus]
MVPAARCCNSSQSSSSIDVGFVGLNESLGNGGCSSYLGGSNGCLELLKFSTLACFLEMKKYKEWIGRRQSTLLLNAQPSLYAGTAANQATLQTTVQMRESATPMGSLGIVLETALLCTAPPMPPGDVRLCNNCYKPGHIAADCTNDKACNNCRRTGHLARDCANYPICNLCNVAGHMARHCPNSNMIGDRGFGGGGYRDHRDIVCHNCHQFGHMSRDCMGPLMICNNCGGRGHMAIDDMRFSLSRVHKLPQNNPCSLLLSLG